MRDLVVREALRTMARDAAKRFRELVSAGAEIPYDVLEAGNGSPLPQYVPLTERFVRDHAPALRELDSFGVSCAAIESADLAAPYLEDFGISVPADPRRRAELAGAVFLCRLWIGSTDFSLDRDRLDAAIDEIEASADAELGEIEVVVPLRGVQMPVARLDLATATIVRADVVDVPSEARASDGLGVAAWEPAFLAVTRVSEVVGDDGEAADAGTRAVGAFRTLITTLRLFKPGGVALGAYAWTRSGSDRWRRVSTGAGRPRPGGYRLAESELAELVSFSRALAVRPPAFGPAARDRGGAAAVLARSISRFEAGLDRHLVLEALNDYLLSLRFLLEGGGPADLGLAMRVAALCAEPERRGEVKAVVERALALERELWSGEPAGADESSMPAQVAAQLEDLARAILKDAACGHLGTDLRATADEILLADGLAVGDGAAEQRGATAEWDPTELDAEPETGELEAWDGHPDEPVEDPDLDLPVEEPDVDEPGPDPDLDEPDLDEGIADPDLDEPEVVAELAGTDHPRSARFAEPELWLDALDEEVEEPPGERGVQGPASRARIWLGDEGEPEEDTVIARGRARTVEAQRPNRTISALQRLTRDRDREPTSAPDPVGDLLELRSAERDAIADRVAHLFPRPEPTEWNVRELDYDRRRGSRVGA